jgi:hypothetical protein
LASSFLLSSRPSERVQDVACHGDDRGIYQVNHEKNICLGPVSSGTLPIPTRAPLPDPRRQMHPDCCFTASRNKKQNPGKRASRVRPETKSLRYACSCVLVDPSACLLKNCRLCEAERPLWDSSCTMASCWQLGSSPDFSRSLSPRWPSVRIHCGLRSGS